MAGSGYFFDERKAAGEKLSVKRLTYLFEHF